MTEADQITRKDQSRAWVVFEKKTGLFHAFFFNKALADKFVARHPDKLVAEEWELAGGTIAHDRRGRNEALEEAANAIDAYSDQNLHPISREAAILQEVSDLVRALSENADA
jgi:hypothetical protein